MILPVSNCDSNASVRVASNLFPGVCTSHKGDHVKTTSKTAEKLAGKAKRVVAEVTGDGKLDEEGCRQEQQAEDKAAEDEKTNVATVANNLT